jgi:hypothetical protein
MSRPKTRVIIGNQYIEEKENNVLDLSQGKVLTTIKGGKGGGDDWLSPLPIGAAFLTKDPEGSPTLSRWQVIEKTERARRLSLELMDGEKQAYRWFIPEEFCKVFEKFEIIHEGPTVELVEVKDEEDKQ